MGGSKDGDEMTLFSEFVPVAIMLSRITFGSLQASVQEKIMRPPFNATVIGLSLWPNIIACFAIVAYITLTGEMQLGIDVCGEDPTIVLWLILRGVLLFGWVLANMDLYKGTD